MMTPDDFRLLTTQYNAGNRFLVVASGAAQLVSSRAEAANLVNQGPGIAFEVRELTAGNYTEAVEEKPNVYRILGNPYSKT